MNNDTYKLLDIVEKMSKDMPTVYDCDGCKYNNGMFKVEQCRGCRVPNGSNWMARQRPTNYEEVPITFTTQTGEQHD